MIARTWYGRSSMENADAYVSFLERKVLKEIRGIEGNHGAYVLKREAKEEGDIEFLVITLWDSMASVRIFAGENPSVAVVEDEAKAVLSRFDSHVTHYDIVISP